MNAADQRRARRAARMAATAPRPASDEQHPIVLAEAQQDHPTAGTARPEPAPPAATARRPEPDQPPASTAPTRPEGVVYVDAAELADLRARARAPQDLDEQRRAQLVEAAVRDGRIAPAQRAGWVRALATDPSSSTQLARLPAGTIPLAPIGYSTVNDTEPGRDGAWF